MMKSAPSSAAQPTCSRYISRTIAPDHPQLLSVAVVGEGDHHLGAGPGELAVELAHCLGKVEHDLRDVGAALEVAASLQLEQVPLRSQHHVLLEALAQPLQASPPWS